MARSVGNIEDLLNEEGELSGNVVFTNTENPLQDPYMKRAEGEISSHRSSVMRKITAIRKSIDVVTKAKEGLDDHATNPIVLNKCRDGAESISELTKTLTRLTYWTKIKIKLLESLRLQFAEHTDVVGTKLDLLDTELDT